MEEVFKKYCKQFTYDNETYEGYIAGEVSYKIFVDELKGLGICYSVRDSKNYQNFKGGSPAIHFDQTSGLPFFTSQWLDMHCIHGKKYYGSKAVLDKQNHPYGKKSRVLKQNTKKIGCPSKMSVIKRHMFTEEKYQGCEKISKYRRDQISAELRDRLKSENKPSTELYFFVKITHSHSHPITGQHMNIHEDLTKRIRELVISGITSVPSVKLHLKEKVSEMFKDRDLPSHLNTAFYPKDEVIYTHIRETLLSLKGSKSDPTALSNEIEEWREEDPSQNVEKKDSLKHSEQLRDLFKNALDMTNNLPPGDYSHIINEVLKINKLMEGCMKRPNEDIALQTICKKRKLQPNTSLELVPLPAKKIHCKFVRRVGENDEIWKTATVLIISSKKQ